MPKFTLSQRQVARGNFGIVALAAGACCALLVLTLPVGLIETLIASSGLSEAIPAAGPPLGMKARLLLAGFAAIMAVGLVAATYRDPARRSLRIEDRRSSGAQGARGMGFAFAKLTALARGRAMPADGRGMPAIRRADAHPDAPVRAPIFASRDFGGLDIFPQPESDRRASLRQAPVADPIPLPRAPVAEPEDAAYEPCREEDEVEAAVAQPGEGEEAPASRPERSLDHLSITELTERLERALVQRGRPARPPVGPIRVIADMPVASAVPVRDAVPQDVEEALRAALGTLRTMTRRPR